MGRPPVVTDRGPASPKREAGKATGPRPWDSRVAEAPTCRLGRKGNFAKPVAYISATGFLLAGTTASKGGKAE